MVTSAINLRRAKKSCCDSRHSKDDRHKCMKVEPAFDYGQYGNGFIESCSYC
jgi:hypothetical protein